MPPEAPAARLGRKTSSRPWRRPQPGLQAVSQPGQVGDVPRGVLHADDGGDVADEAADLAGGEAHSGTPRGVVEHEGDVAGGGRCAPAGAGSGRR